MSTDDAESWSTEAEPLVEAQVADVRGACGHEEAPGTPGAAAAHRLLDEGPAHAGAAPCRDDCHACELDRAGLCGLHELQRADDAAFLDGDEDLALAQDGIDLLLGVIGEAEQGPQRLAVALVCADLHAAILADARSGSKPWREPARS